MHRPYSERWIWALGLVTAAATCLSPADEPPAEAETAPLEHADATQPSGLRPVLRHPTPPVQLEEDVEPDRSGSAPGTSPPPGSEHVAKPIGSAGVSLGTSRSLRCVGTPLYLVAPKQSPPSAAPPALS